MSCVLHYKANMSLASAVIRVVFCCELQLSPVLYWEGRLCCPPYFAIGYVMLRDCCAFLDTHRCPALWDSVSALINYHSQAAMVSM